MPCNPNSSKGKGPGCDDCTCHQSESQSQSQSSFPIKPNRSDESTPLLWSTTPNPQQIHQESSSPSQDVPGKCEILIHPGANSRRTCCRELKKDDRSLVDPDVIRDCIIGLSDGLTVPFALTAGLSGVGNSRIVVLAGLAELVSGSISMGIGGFLSAQAESQQYVYQTQQTRARVARSCQGEMEREVAQVLEPFGLSEEISAKVAIALREAERENSSENSQNESDSILPLNRRDSTSMRINGSEKGLTPFLLRHEGIQPIASSRMYVSAILIASSYFLGGLIPLLPYVFLKNVKDALFASVIVTGIILLIFGMVKQRATGGQCDAKGLAYSALSTLSVGGLAAGASFAIVKALEA